MKRDNPMPNIKRNRTVKSKSKERIILKIILWIYIVLCLGIAGLNFGYASKADPKIAEYISWFWHFYENWIKTIFIIVCSILTIRIIGASKRTALRKRNLIGFTIAALIVHIISPFLLGNKEIYFFAMPLPWTTTPIQLLYPETSFYQSHFPIWGAAGISAALIFYLCASAIVIIGTLLLGRRWQCSTLCLFNGFAAEVFAPVMPLIGKGKKVQPNMLKTFMIIRWIFLIIAVGFTVWWLLFLAGVSVPGDYRILSKIETYKYLSTELLMAMFFWFVFLGRGYCYYCPLGTVLALISKLAGQRILTDNTKCIQCGQCNAVCPMHIDIKNLAKTSQPVKEIRCVGCGHCIDACPTETLSYATRFLLLIKKLRNRKKPSAKKEENDEKSDLQVG